MGDKVIRARIQLAAIAVFASGITVSAPLVAQTKIEVAQTKIEVAQTSTFGSTGSFQAQPSYPQAGQASNVISDIIVEGAQRVEAGTIKSYLVIRPGDLYSPQRVDRSLKSLFSTGMFADVSIQRKGNALVVNVVENPIINRIAFEGNDELLNNDLSAEVALKPRVIYTRAKVQADVKRILTLYRRSGRYAASVAPKIIQLPQNRIDLVFEVNEGELTEVNSIRFVGNREYDDSKLRSVIRTKETAFYRMFSSDDNYDPDRLTLDRELLRRYYLGEGYADFRVLSAVAELTPDQTDFFITFSVDEGPRYEFGKVEIVSNIKKLTVDMVSDILEFESDDWYDVEAVDDTVDKLTNRVGELGFAFVDVRPRVARNAEENKVDITFEINEGSRIFVERIDIQGNVRTKDKVIRREFRLAEGDAFNSSKLRRSQTRIRNLNFFETVNVSRVPGSSPDKTIVNVVVEEKSTGSISLGAGFSTTAGMLLEVGLKENNFLGNGQAVDTKITFAETQKKYLFSFTEPFFMGREVRAGIDLFRNEEDLQDTSSVDTLSQGVTFRAGYPITEKWSQAWAYTFRIDETGDVASSASPLIKNDNRKDTVSQVVHKLTYNSLDNNLSPTEGHVVRFQTTLAGLGGNVRMLKNTLSGGKYYPVMDGVVFSLSGKTGYALGLGEDVSFSNRYYIGGDDLRGFASAGVGPRDTSTRDALGGVWVYTGTAQIDFPTGLPQELGLRARAFVDLGSSGDLSPKDVNTADDGSIRVSSGIGITWQSPMGPIGFDFGIPLVKEDYDITENVRVNFGARF